MQTFAQREVQPHKLTHVIQLKRAVPAMTHDASRMPAYAEMLGSQAVPPSLRIDTAGAEPDGRGDRYMQEEGSLAQHVLRMPEPRLQAACACGKSAEAGGECEKCSELRRLGLQTKLEVNEPGDTYEQEADRVAWQVTRTPEPQVQRTCACVKHTGDGGECAECREKRLGLQRRAESNSGRGSAPPIVQEVLRQPGRPLDERTRGSMESRFGPYGPDFGHVRVHTDEKAAESAKAVSALAYTVGNHIVFSSGKYSPDTAQGTSLLAHELTHVLQQGPTLAPARVLQREGETCTRTFTRARSFVDYIALVREAETRLAAAGYTSVGDRVHVLRGIYYGTEWSADFAVERSPVRNVGFQTYTASLTPDDPRPILTCGLFEALRDSQDLTDSGRQVDVGHLMIGLDARRSTVARNVPIPTQGGTGLAIATWLGDLGGGAGMLASRRVADPTRRVMTVFTGSDFGGSINLEGDVAGFLVGRDTSATPSGAPALAIPAGRTIADALRDYLMPTSLAGTPSSEWQNRCMTFLQIYGGAFDSSGTLTNRASLVASFKSQIQDFACWYLVNRLRQSGRLSLSTLRAASLHIPSTSEEVATVFVDALTACQSSGGARLAATGAGPSPLPPSASAPTPCALAIGAIEAAQQAEGLWREGQRRAGELWQQLSF